jgi:hypothetical protein
MIGKGFQIFDDSKECFTSGVESVAGITRQIQHTHAALPYEEN